MDNGFHYGDIIFLALIAVFVVLRLRSMLGRNIGFGGSEAPKPATSAALMEHIVQRVEKSIKPAAEEDDVLLTAAPAEVKDGIAAIRAADAEFSLQDFLRGAKGAFDMVLNAFTKNDKDTLKSLMSPALFDTFAAEIDARQSKAEKHETTLVSIKNAEVAEAMLRDKNTAHITVQFTSEQIHVTRNAAGAIIEGSPSAVVQVEDYWSFERDPKSRNPNWTIVAT